MLYYYNKENAILVISRTYADAEWYVNHRFSVAYGYEKDETLTLEERGFKRVTSRYSIEMYKNDPWTAIWETGE